MICTSYRIKNEEYCKTYTNLANCNLPNPLSHLMPEAMALFIICLLLFYFRFWFFSPDYSVQYKNLAAEQSIDVTKSSTNPLVYSPRNNEIISFPRKCIYSGNKRFRQVDR